jgi:glycosyltransferase involved in cell wall biosynthesis
MEQRLLQGLEQRYLQGVVLQCQQHPALPRRRVSALLKYTDMSQKEFAVNARVLANRLTGVERYTAQLLQQWNGKVARLAPTHPRNGLAGHAWEQFVLPARLEGRLLFSPSNSGPLAVSRQVVTVHDMSVFDCAAFFHMQFAAWYQFLIPKLVKVSRKVITVSEFTKERILKWTKVAADKIAVVHPGVDTHFSPAAISRKPKILTELKIPSANYILTVGSLEPRKNLAALLRAWSKIESTMPEVWLVVSGTSGNPRVFNSAGLGKLPRRVILTGHISDEFLAGLYAGALAVAYPSLYEGFGLVPLEAMASGTAVLVGNCASLTEVVGDAALIVDPRSEDELSEGLMRLVQDHSLRERLSSKGLQRAGQFRHDQSAQKVWQILESAA